MPINLDDLQKKYEKRFKNKHKKCHPSYAKIPIAPRTQIYSNGVSGKMYKGMGKSYLKVGKMHGAV